MSVRLLVCLSFSIVGFLFSNDGSSEVPYLGVATKPVSAEIRHQLNFQEGFYLSIESVAEGSPAEKAGFMPFDIISKIDDQILVNPQQLRTLVRSKEIGASVVCTFWRHGKAEDVKVALGGIDPSELLGDFGQGFQGGGNSVRGAWSDFWSNGAKLPGRTINQSSRATVIKNDSRVIACRDKDCTIKLRLKSDGSRYLEVRNEEGEIIFEGDVSSKEQMAQLSKDIRARVRELEEINIGGPSRSLPNQSEK